MLLEEGHIYHIFNQGNNREKIFFERDNYLFFLDKIKQYILPHTKILAWCLMPNHFHLMVEVVKLEAAFHTIDGVTIDGVTQSHPVNSVPAKLRIMNDSIGIMLRSYTRAINKRFNRTGALFREETKSQCLSTLNGITPPYFDTFSGTIINIERPEDSYIQVCFNYIHNNPVNAGMVKNATDWEFSSAQDFYGLRQGKLINRERIRYFELV